ncbi:hypothetical protein ACE5D9_04980 [Rickettsia sp. 2024-CO-Wats]|uniref:hypothetical protein n=1 Tax=unclassified Rickettsia TaxID=114295 RepID=UPI00370DE12F
MKKANTKLEEALYSMEEGILNLRKQKASLEEIFTFLQDLIISYIIIESGQK